MANLAETDRRWSLTGTLLFHVTIVGLLFLLKCGNGGGGGNGGLGYTGLMSLDAAGIGTMVDGEGYVPMPEPVIEEPTPEAAEQANAITDDTSEEAPIISDKKQSENRKSDTQARNDKTQPQNQQQVSNNLNNAFNNIKGGNGNTTGTGQQGDPNGSINGKGVLGGGGSSGSGGGSGGGNGTGNGPGSGSGSGMSWKLDGRSIINTPKVTGTAPDDGTVAVDIWVDANGNVTKAIANAAKSNTSNGTLFKMAEEAARKAKFSTSATGTEQMGSIKITFTLK
jgi:TonB family protein